MPGRPHHTDKMRSCVEKVIAGGQDESSAYAICTTSLKKAGEPIFEAASVVAAEGDMEDMRQLHLLGATGQSRLEMYDGREHLVIPVVALMDGVIHAVNAANPERVTEATLAKAASSWNGRPLTLGHPVKDGKQISANDARVLETQSFGQIFNSRMSGPKLLMDAYIDPVKAEKIGGKELLQHLRDGKMCEVSVGAFVVTDDVPGEHNGKAFKATWLDTLGDHLAFLPKGRGACSMTMGCGANRAAAMRVCEDHLEVLEDGKDEELKVAAGPLSDNAHVLKDGDKVTINRPGHPSHGKSGEITATTKDSHVIGGLGTFHKSRLKAAGLYDTPEEAASEEAAELIGYETMAELLDQVGSSYDQVKSLINDLISDETKDPTQTPAEEEAEEEVEDARLTSIQTLCMSMYGSLNSIMSVASNLLQPDAPDVAIPRYMGIRASAVKMEDCAACKGTGNKDGNPCDVCDGAGELKAAAGARNSATDAKTIQGIHDYSAKLGATCDAQNTKWLEEKKQTVIEPVVLESEKVETVEAKAAAAIEVAEVILKAACRCEGEQMTPEIRAEVIKTLIADKHSGFTTGDEKMLESASDERLESFKVAAEARALEVKEVKELKAAGDRQLSEEDFMKAAPPSLRSLITRQQERETLRKADLVAALKTAQDEYAEAALSAMPVDELERMARMTKAKVQEKHDYSGRGLAFVGSDADDFTPPDPYADGIKALKAQQGSSVN